MMEKITTRNRRLEQFFFLHGVDYISVGKDEDGMTIWVYEINPENIRIVREFQVAQKRRNAKKGA